MAWRAKKPRTMPGLAPRLLNSLFGHLVSYHKQPLYYRVRHPAEPLPAPAALFGLARLLDPLADVALLPRSSALLPRNIQA